VPKTYLHLYGENKLRLDLRQKMDVLGGMTPLEVEKNAYLKHESQQWTWFYVDDEYEYSCAAFGLYRTTVGNDSGINDMMENIVSYAEQERTPEPTPEPTPTPESGETSVPGTATPEENPTETPTEIPAETPDATPEGGKTDPDKGTKNNVGRIILGIVLLLAAAALFFFVLVPLMSKILNRKRK
jgi:hypothetical protein